MLDRYETEAAAEGAITSMNGFELGGRQLKVGHASVSGNTPPGNIADPGAFNALPKTGAALAAADIAATRQASVQLGTTEEYKASRCCVLSNMVEAEEVDEELEEEVREECSKYGAVAEVVIHAEKPSDAHIRVFVLFSTPAGDTPAPLPSLLLVGMMPRCQARWGVEQGHRQLFEPCMGGGSAGDKCWPDSSMKESSNKATTQYDR